MSYTQILLFREQRSITFTGTSLIESKCLSLLKKAHLFFPSSPFWSGSGHSTSLWHRWHHTQVDYNSDRTKGLGILKSHSSLYRIQHIWNAHFLCVLNTLQTLWRPSDFKAALSLRGAQDRRPGHLPGPGVLEPRPRPAQWLCSALSGPVLISFHPKPDPRGIYIGWK